MTQNATVIVAAPGIEHLEWLRLSCTQGMARDLVENFLLGTPGFERYRYATIDETASLLHAYYADPIDNNGNIIWKQNAALAAQRFFADFGITSVLIANPPRQLDSDDGYLSYDMLRYAYFYCGAYGTDIEGTLNPPATIVGRVGEALDKVDRQAGLFTYGELCGFELQGQAHYSSLLVRKNLTASSTPSIRAIS